MRKTKLNIIKTMNVQEVNIKLLSMKTGINVLNLFFILYSPFSKIKLTHFISISRALKVSMSDLI